MCDYQGYEFGAGYLDSVCVDGSLQDADNCDSEGNIYLQEEDIPCPICRPDKAIEWWKGHGNKNAALLVTDICKNRGVERGNGER